MEISISDMGSLAEMGLFAPEKARQLAEHILNLNRKLYVLSNKRAKDFYKIQSISESQQILRSIFSGFISFFQDVSELLKKDGDKDNLKRLTNDFTNLRKEINQQTHELMARPSNMIYTKYWFDADSLISQPINSLILSPLITSWKESKKEIKANLFECDKNKFYETFHKEVLFLIGQFPVVQVFQMKKAMASPVISPSELRNQILGVFTELKTTEKIKEEIKPQIPPELTEKSKEESEDEPKEEPSKEVFSEEDLDDEDEEEIEEDEG